MSKPDTPAMKPIREQIEWLEYQSKVLDGHDVAPFLRAILSTLRAVEAAEKELPEEPDGGDLLEHLDYQEKLRNRLAVAQAQIERLTNALAQTAADKLRAYAVAQKVREHD